jgi:elongation factor 1-alpha
LAKKDLALKWYEGPSLLKALKDTKGSRTKKKIEEDRDKPLRMPIKAVYQISGVGTVAVGMVESGVLKPGQLLRLGPGNITAECNSIEMGHQPVSEAGAGDVVGVSLKNVPRNLIKRGFVLSDDQNDPLSPVASFIVRAIVLNHPSMIKKGYSPVFTNGFSHIPCKFEHLL